VFHGLGYPGPIQLVAGEFIFVVLGVPDGYEYHLFTVASARTDTELRLSIGAAGDYTRRLHQDLRPGIEARIVGPFGTFDYRRGEARQVWVAAGIGITPFMSWIRALDGSFAHDVDFYYAVADEAGALYVDEIRAAAARYPSLRFHLSESDRDGRLTPEQLWADHPIAEASIDMCGPAEMMRAFEAKLRDHGVARDHIRWEQFGLR
jgi:predicted ferric reductase